MTTAADDANADAAGAPDPERIWLVPPPCRAGFPDLWMLCLLLPLAVAWLELSPTTPMTTLAVGIGAILVIQAGWFWLLTIPWTPRELRLGPEGLLPENRRMFPWEGITKISGRRSGWLVIECGIRWLFLPPCPAVFREVIPEVLRRLPKVDITRLARRTIEDPDAAGAVPARRKLMVLALGLVVALVPVFVRQASNWWLLVGLVLPVCLLFLVPGWRFTIDRERRAMAGQFVYAGLLPLVYAAVTVADIPLGVLDGLAEMVAILFLLAVFSAVFDWKPRRWVKFAILFFALAVPLAVSRLENAWGPKRTEITNLVDAASTATGFRWLPDGKTMMVGTNGKRRSLFDAAAMRNSALPDREADGMVVDMDEAVEVRFGFPARTRVLFLSRLGDGNEVDLSQGMKQIVMLGRCISPLGGQVCWLATTESNDPQPVFLMVHDVQARATRQVNVAWPEANDIEWETCWWIDGNTIAVKGLSPRRDLSDSNQNKSLHVLRVECRSGATQHLNVADQWEHWAVSPDARHAFAHGSQLDGNRLDLCYIDMVSSRRMPLADGAMPSWQQDGRAAWRVHGFGENNTWLCRFRLDEVKEERVLRIPPGSRLDSLSPRGRFAILFDGLRIRPLRLVRVETGEELRLDDASVYAAIGIMGDWREGVWVGQFRSIWSPDETRFAVPSYHWTPRVENATGRLFIYDVPPAWLK